MIQSTQGKCVCVHTCKRIRQLQVHPQVLGTLASQLRRHHDPTSPRLHNNGSSKGIEVNKIIDGVSVPHALEKFLLRPQDGLGVFAVPHLY